MSRTRKSVVDQWIVDCALAGTPVFGMGDKWSSATLRALDKLVKAGTLATCKLSFCNVSSFRKAWVRADLAPTAEYPQLFVGSHLLALAARPAPVNAPSNETLLADIATIPTTLPSLTSALGRRREVFGAHAG